MISYHVVLIKKRSKLISIRDRFAARFIRACLYHERNEIMEKLNCKMSLLNQIFP